MEEKVIHELRIVETEDGFRIEIKGDKERLRGLFEHGMLPFGLGRMGQGPFGHHHGPFGRHEHGGRHGFGPFGHHREDAPWWTEEKPKSEEA